MSSLTSEFGPNTLIESWIQKKRAIHNPLHTKELAGKIHTHNDGLANSDVCQGGTAAPPQDPGKGEQICATQATPNATRAMISCCSNAAANGTGLIPFDNGRNIACSSESTDGQFSKCLSDAFDPQIGIVCSKQEDSKTSNKDGYTSGALSGSTAQHGYSRDNSVGVVGDLIAYCVT